MAGCNGHVTDVTDGLPGIKHQRYTDFAFRARVRLVVSRRASNQWGRATSPPQHKRAHSLCIVESAREARRVTVSASDRRRSLSERQCGAERH